MDEIIAKLTEVKQMLENTEHTNLKSEDGWSVIDNAELWWKAELAAQLLETIIKSLSEV